MSCLKWKPDYFFNLKSVTTIPKLNDTYNNQKCFPPNTTLNFSMKCDEGYQFSKPVIISDSANNKNLIFDKFNSDFTFIEISLPTGSQYSNFEFVQLETKKYTPPVKQYTFTINEDALLNCTCDIPSGTKFNEGSNFTFTLTTDEGYIFDTYVQYKEGNITSQETNFTEGDTKCVITVRGNNDVVLQYAKANQKPKPTTSSFVNIYEVDNPILNSIASERFIDYNANKLDIGSFILSLYELPLQIPEEFILNKRKIQFGYALATTEAPLVNTQYYEVNLGSITIPEKYKNAYDYINTECVLRIPFYNTINLPIEYAINHTLYFKFIIDLYNGVCTLNINSSFNNNIVYSESQNIATLIPVINSYNVVRNTYSSRFYNSLNKVSVEITRNVPYYSEEMNNKLGKPVIKYDTLNTYKGYISVSNLDITSENATNNEVLEIESLLEDGITIL